MSNVPFFPDCRWLGLLVVDNIQLLLEVGSLSVPLGKESGEGLRRVGEGRTGETNSSGEPEGLRWYSACLRPGRCGSRRAMQVAAVR